MAVAGGVDCSRVIARAVSRQRSSGLVTTAARASPASRSPAAWACSVPRSSRCTPLLRPASTPVAFAVVRPCRARISGWHVAEARARTLSAMIVDSALYRDGVRVPVDCTKEDLAELRDRGDRRRRLRVGRHARARRGRAEPRRGDLLAAPAGRRGRAQRAPAAQARALRRRALPGPQDPLVRRRGRRRRDRGDQPVRRPQLHRQRPARQGHRAAQRAAGPGAADRRARARAVRGGLRDLRPGRRRVRVGRDRAGGGRRRGRGLGVLAGPHPGLPAHLHPQARARRGAPSGPPAPRADEALRHRVGAVRDPGSRTVLPGRHRPRASG